MVAIVLLAADARHAYVLAADDWSTLKGRHGLLSPVEMPVNPEENTHSGNYAAPGATVEDENALLTT